jgi:hypothetical protein
MLAGVRLDRHLEVAGGRVTDHGALPDAIPG